MATIEELEAKIASYDERLAGLSKAYDDLKKDARMMVTGDAPQSMQIAYSPTLKSKVFEKAPFFRFLESKGTYRVFDDDFDDDDLFDDDDGDIAEIKDIVL